MGRALAALLWASVTVITACTPVGVRPPDATHAAPPGHADGPATATPAHGLEVRYLANEGFLVEGAGRRVLVDALFGSGIAGYAAVEPALRSALERGAQDWGDVRVGLATHYHGDHFDGAAVGRFLAANPEAVFVSTPQAEASWREAGLGLPEGGPSQGEVPGRFRSVLPAAGDTERLEIGGVVIDVLNLHHGRRDPPVENLGFVVTLGDLRFLHFGDTEAKIEDFEPYLELVAEVDLAILPFWFLSSEWRAEMVRDRIRPRWIVAAHTPLPNAPAGYFARWSSYDDLVRTMSDAFPAAIIPRQQGESWKLGPGGSSHP